MATYGLAFRLQLQTIDIAADRVDQLQPDLIAALIRLGEVAPLKQRLDDAISRALMQADLICDFRQSHRTPRFCHCFDDIQRSVDRLYSLIFCHRLPLPFFSFLCLSLPFLYCNTKVKKIARKNFKISRFPSIFLIAKRPLLLYTEWTWKLREMSKSITHEDICRPAPAGVHLKEG